MKKENENPVMDMKLHSGTTVNELASQLANSGFQGQNIGEAVEIVRKMAKEKATIFLSFTSNMAASGLRGIFRDLVKKEKIGVIVTTSGTIDEDFIRCHKPYLQGTFEADDEELGRMGINRMGNIFVPNDRYECMENEVPKILEDIYKTRKELTPSELIHELGMRMKSEESIIYWAARNNIPIFCPGITDGAFGMQLHFFQQSHPDFRMEVVRDLRRIVGIALAAEKTGAIILGGGIAKHHTILANLLRDGFDYAVYINSSTPYRGSLSGATTSEARSWGKIREGAHAVTVFGDAQVIFPIIVSSVREFFD